MLELSSAVLKDSLDDSRRVKVNIVDMSDEKPIGLVDLLGERQNFATDSHVIAQQADKLVPCGSLLTSDPSAIRTSLGRCHLHWPPPHGGALLSRSVGLCDQRSSGHRLQHETRVGRTS